MKTLNYKMAKNVELSELFLGKFKSFLQMKDSKVAILKTCMDTMFHSAPQHVFFWMGR